MATGKISIIKKDFDPKVQSFDNSLAMHGLQRAPGTYSLKFPYKENNGKYRTGLDPEASYIRRMTDKNLKEIEIARVTALRDRLQEELQIDLSPTSSYYNYNSNATLKVSPYKLDNSDAVFDLSNPHQAITFAWLSVHPTIAPSYEAYASGSVSADTQWFVNDDDAETKIVYGKKKSLNSAIVKLDSLSLEKRKKIARLMGLPYSNDSKEDTIYNGLDNLIRLDQMPSGTYKDRSPIDIFTTLVNLNSDVLDVSDLVEQAFRANIYRFNKGKVFEGELEAWSSKNELIDHLLDTKNQNDRLALEKKIQLKNIQS